MLRVLGDGESRHRLEDRAGTHVGWIRGRTVGFHGLASEDAAMHAALSASQALDQVLRRTYPGWVRQHPKLEELRLVHDGAYEWFTDGTVPIARLLRIRTDMPRGSSFGVELVLPSYASEGVAITAAQAIGRALRSHIEIQWDAVPDDEPPLGAA